MDYGHTWKRNITRDEIGRITTISIETYNINEFKETRRTTITYGEDGLADTWKHEELTYNGMNLAWEEFYTLRDMQWYSTDGQITAEDINEFYTGNNRLKSARVEEPDFGEVGTITASYEENGNYSYSYNYNDPVARDVTTVTYTDEYGSVTEDLAYYEDIDEDGVASDEELQESYKSVLTCNEQGETISEEFFFDDEFDSGAKYDVIYGDYAYPTEWTMSEYDSDMEDYVPFIKLVRSHFVDVTTATSIDAVPAVEGNAAQGVYNLQGVKVAQSIDHLPAGLYIVKMNGQSRKIIKK